MVRTRRGWITRLAAAAFALAIAGSALAQGGPPPPPPLTPLPPPPQPAGNPVTTSKANLGKALFWDEQMSTSRTMACGSCHRAGSGGSDPRTLAPFPTATNPGPDAVLGTPDDIVGSPGSVLHASESSLDLSATFGLRPQVTGRMAPSHINAAYAPELFWDGRAGGTFNDPLGGATILPVGGALENQALAPPASSVEMGHTGRDWSNVAARIAASTPLALALGIPGELASWIAGRDYPQLFADAFGSSDVTPARIVMAIASYERTLFSTQTPFDTLIAGTNTLTPQENAGFVLFGQLPCARCHGGALMSDNQYHYNGVRPAAEDSGRMVVTHAPVDLGAFRTPSLRNVALRPAFMHDGRFRTLADVIAFYDRGGDFNAPNKSPLITPLNLAPQQRAALLAFLGRPLTDPRVAAGAAPFDKPTLYTESPLVPQVLPGGTPGGGGSPPQPVALEPALLGNPSFTVGVFNAAGGANAVLVVDDAAPPADAVPASGSLARLETTLQGSGASGGFGSVSLAIPTDAGQAGHVYFGRWYVLDAAAPGGLAASPAFRFEVFGPNGAGSSVLAVSSPAKVIAGARLYAGWPNPFTSSTSVRFDLLQGGRVKLEVYDVSGRRQRVLDDRAWASPGVYTSTWDGRDDGGRAVPAGAYFYRLETSRGALTARTVHVR